MLMALTGWVFCCCCIQWILCCTSIGSFIYLYLCCEPIGRLCSILSKYSGHQACLEVLKEKRVSWIIQRGKFRQNGGVSFLKIFIFLFSLCKMMSICPQRELLHADIIFNLRISQVTLQRNVLDKLLQCFLDFFVKVKWWNSITGFTVLYCVKYKPVIFGHYNLKSKFYFKQRT